MRKNGFTLVEILVVVVLLSFIVLALMAVFSGTQAAFRASVTQTDVLEAGRNVMGLIKSDLESMSPGHADHISPTNSPNLYIAASNTFSQPLAGSSKSHDYVMEDVFFITKENQNWKFVAYFVRSNLLASSAIGTPGTLYRFETNYSADQFNRLGHTAAGPWAAYTAVRQNSITNSTGISRLADGVMGLRVRAYDSSGTWITSNLVLNGVASIFASSTNSISTGEPADFYMINTMLPASIEVELAILEDRTLQRVESLQGSFKAQTNYLAGQAAKIHIFRQRIPIRSGVAPMTY